MDILAQGELKRIRATERGLQLVESRASAAYERLVVAVSSSHRPGTLQRAVIHALAETATCQDLASVIYLDTLPRLPHFDMSAGCAGITPVLAQTGALLDQSDAVVFCVAEYAEGLPAIVGNLLEWAIAGGFLSGKRTGWINVAADSSRAQAAHDSLERTLRFAGADIALRADIPLAATQVSESGLLTIHPNQRTSLVSALEQLLLTRATLI